MNTNFTQEANYIINRDFLNKNIAFIDEYLSHDGYDRFGPKSYLWDLYIVEDINNEFYFYDYHWENWFSKFDSHEYELWKRKKLKECNFHELEKILKKKEKISERLHNEARNLYNEKLEK